MNKTVVDANLPYAYDAVKKYIAGRDGKVNKSYRGQISTLGAAMTMGSMRSAICFFKEKANNDTPVDRSKLLTAIKYVLDQNAFTRDKYKTFKDLWDCAKNVDDKQMREDMINAAIAIKLSMNLFDWEGEA